MRKVCAELTETFLIAREMLFNIFVIDVWVRAKRQEQ